MGRIVGDGSDVSMGDLGLTQGDRSAGVAWSNAIASVGRVAAVALLAGTYRSERRQRWGIALHLAALAGMLEQLPDATTPTWTGPVIWVAAVVAFGAIVHPIERWPAVLLPMYAAMHGAVRLGVLPPDPWNEWAWLIGLFAFGWGMTRRFWAWVVGVVVATGVLMVVGLLWARPSHYYYDWRVFGLGDLQFGDVDGDGHLDLMTWGCQGRGCGNVHWFAGTGRRFPFGHGGDDIATQTWAVWCDADGDGDLDAVTPNEVLLNDGRGGLSRARDPEPVWAFDRPVNPVTGRPIDPFRSDVFQVHDTRTAVWDGFEGIAVDLDGQSPPEIFLRYQQACELAVGRGPGRWAFIGQMRAHAVQIDFGRPRAALVGPPELAGLAARNGIAFRARRPMPEPPRGRYLDDWLDLDGDGHSELVVVAFSGDIERNFLYREHPDRWELLASIEYRAFGSQPAPARHRWVDLDRDGDLDLVADDRRVYRHDPAWQFSPVRDLDLEVNYRSHLWVVDVDRDGWPDVVSSLRPWSQLIRGPLVPAPP